MKRALPVLCLAAIVCAMAASCATGIYRREGNAFVAGKLEETAHSL